MIKKIAFVTLSLLVCQVVLAQDSNTTGSWWEEAVTTNDEYNDEYNNKVYDYVEQMPSFPGGQAALMSYLNKNIKYPRDAYDNDVQGRVVCSFIVERDGSITDVRFLYGLDDYPSLFKEAKRVLEAMPKWNPGKQNGKFVRVKYSVPVIFKLP